MDLAKYTYISKLYVLLYFFANTALSFNCFVPFVAHTELKHL